jgi:DUF1680 family protein
MAAQAAMQSEAGMGTSRLAVVLMGVVASAAHAQIADYPIEPVPFTAVQIRDAFWQPRMRTNTDVTVAYAFEQCEKTGRIANFAVAGGRVPGDFEGIYFNDSDVFKVIEGAAYTLALAPDPELDAYLDGLIAKIAAAQEDDGYLYTIRTIRGDDTGAPGTGPTRWSNLRVSHELYNVGHLYEAAVAHYLATGKRTLLDVALKNADLVDRVFGPGADQRRDPPGHQEIELGLVKLYRVTGQRRYLALARFFLDQRGERDGHELYGDYAQDHARVITQTQAVGHAVRAGYMYSAMADIAALAQDPAYTRAVGRLWEDVVYRKLYLTGGIGARRAGEAFGEAYELPNASAYAETCAAIANALWNHRMFLLHGEAKYIDVLERVLYNGFLSGVSFSGDRFFYPNPLAADGVTRFNQGHCERAPWFACSCCPVNVVRFMPSIAGYVYATKRDRVYVNLYIGGTATVPVAGADVQFTQTTDYPWDGQVRIEVTPPTSHEFTLRLRIPGWARNKPVPGGLYRFLEVPRARTVVRVNGKLIPSKLVDGYAELRRTWRIGDVVEVEFPMYARRVVARDEVAACAGRVALERGPIVYCLEGVDHDGAVADLVLPPEAELRSTFEPELLRGVTTIRAAGQRVSRAADGGTRTEPCNLRAVPYYAWAHRGPGAMAVWIANAPEHARPTPLPTVASLSQVSASHTWRTDTLTALNDQREPRSSNDHGIPRHTWWDHRGTTEWVQYDFAEPTSVSRVAVYWFDDSDRGGCRVPASWRLLYRRDGAWYPVAAPAFGVERDGYNEVAFEPVTTDALRIEATLRAGYSGGILEWRVD